MLSIKDFSEFFFDKTRDWNWEVEGFLDTKGFVHPIDRDTKVISTVFERLSSPVVRSLAKTVQYAVELANQTTYPDFTLTYFDSGQRKHRIAIDIKTTYLSNTMMFTLGGYNSFLPGTTRKASFIPIQRMKIIGLSASYTNKIPSSRNTTWITCRSKGASPVRIPT